jgi:hypothetical protein
LRPYFQQSNAIKTIRETWYFSGAGRKIAEDKSYEVLVKEGNHASQTVEKLLQKKVQSHFRK